MADTPGTGTQDRRIGHTLKETYVLRERVGGGAFGVVYRAQHVKLGSSVAVKFLRPHADELTRERFKREARIAATLAHPNIARVMDIDHEDGDTPFLIMEWIAGVSLRDLLRQRGALSFAETVDLFHQFGAAIEAAHAQGVIHRDLKPDNLMLSEQGGAVLLKVLDFGMARVADSHGTLTQEAVVGTPAYFAPEAIRTGSKNVDRRSDIYSMGLILFECLSGRQAFDGEPMEIVARHIMGTAVVPHLMSLVPGLPPQIDDVIAHACAPDPAQRFATSWELVQALLALTHLAVGDTAQLSPTNLAPARTTGPLGALTSQSLPSSLTKSANSHTGCASLPIAATEQVSAATTAPHPAPARRRRLSSVAVALATLVVASGLGLLQVRSRTVVLSSVPPGAAIWMDETYLGSTPQKLPVPTPCELTLVLKGYEAKTITITRAGRWDVELIPSGVQEDIFNPRAH